MRLSLAAAFVCAGSMTLASAAQSVTVETLKPSFALPPHVLATMQEPVSIAATAEGDYLILDRRGHALYRVTRKGIVVRRFGQIGYEPGNLLRPSGLSMGRDDVFAVMDSPNGVQRIQYLTTEGRHIGQFYLPILGAPSVVIADAVVTGAAAMAFTGKSFLVNEPAWGSLVAELDTSGAVIRHVGQLRPTGYEGDKDLHLSFNTGIPVVDPTGGFYFVFQTGVPVFRKYDADGRLVFERHIEGPDLDPLIQTLPNRWPARPQGTAPFPQPMIRTAAVDASGRLWVALRTSVTYVYGTTGEKERMIRFQGVRPIVPSSFFFTKQGYLLVGPEGYEFDVRQPARPTLDE